MLKMRQRLGFIGKGFNPNVDPLRSFVALHVLGTDGTVVDNSGHFTLTNYKSRCGFAGPGPFGGTTTLHTLAAGSYAGYPLNAAPAFGQNEFCLECWTYQDGVADGVLFMAVYSGGTITYRPQFYIKQNAGNKNISVFSRILSNTTRDVNFTSPVNSLQNGWNHIALTVTRTATNSVYTLYINGVAVASSSNGDLSTVSWNTFNLLGAEYLGQIPYYGNSGKVCDFRITIGNPRYTENFTPPSQYSPTA